MKIILFSENIIWKWKLLKFFNKKKLCENAKIDSENNTIRTVATKIYLL